MTNLDQVCEQHRKRRRLPGENAAVVFEQPEDLGTTYEEVMANLRKLQDADLYCSFVKKPPPAPENN